MYFVYLFCKVYKNKYIICGCECHVILYIAGNWSPNCSIEYQPFVMSEKASVGDCSDTVYTCSNPSERPVQCIDGESELFRIDCLPSPPEEIRFKFCSLVSLRDKVGQQTVITVFSSPEPKAHR